MTKKLRVLIPVDHAVGISGPHRNVVGTLNALGRRDDVEVVLLTSKIDEEEPYAKSPNLDIRLGFSPHDPKRALANTLRIQRAARGCDVIYVPSGLKALLYAQTARFGKRVVAGPNVTPLPLPRAKRMDSPGSIELRGLCDLWLEASNARRDHVRRISGDQSVTTVHHAIDTEKFSPEHRDPAIWERFGIPMQGNKIVYVGRDNEPRKGVAQLLDAAELIDESGALFILVGDMGADTKARAKTMTNVYSIGVQKGAALSALYASSDIAIVPSSWENFPFTVMEAQSSGIPIVGSRTGGIPEMICDGETGFLVDISDGQSHLPDAGRVLSNAIMKLVQDPNLRTRMGLAGRQRTLSFFSEDRLGNDLMQLLQP